MNVALLIDTHQSVPEVCNLLKKENRHSHNLCVNHLFEAQVERTPNAIAIVFKDQQLTYQTLNTKANQLAQYLKKLGVGPEVLVGVGVERSLEMIVGVLGILKAGGAYVPLDPNYPKARLALMLADSQISVLLTQEKWVTKFTEQKTQIVCLDTDEHQIAQESVNNPNSEVTINNLAYVIYTSGSTGLPKGVAIEHRSVLNLANALAQAIYANYPSTLRISLNGSLAFDTSVKQIIQLLYGHTLCIIPEEVRFEGSTLLDYLNDQQIEVLDCTPAQLALLVTAGLLSASKLSLKCVLIGGEAIPPAMWQVLSQQQNIPFYNVYGPTECTVDATVGEVGASAKPVIGRPLEHVQIYLLDQQLQPVPIGEAGEIHIGGAGLARGYLKRPALTAERFIPNPFSNASNARLYKTGDVGRLLPDGNIEFLGRVDSQVKLRGYRIELGEIESVLTQHPGVQEAVVMVREDTLNDKRLVSYIVPEPTRSPTIAGKTRYRLPNNLAVVQLNKNETDFLYQEIFVTQAYLKHGITIKEGDCVVDVGTNIGLFTLFAHLCGKNVQIYGFEPNPFVFELLNLNTTLYQVNAKLFNCGLSQQTRTEHFTFYPQFSFLSGLYADVDDEKAVVRSFLRQQAQSGNAALASDHEIVEELLTNKFNRETFAVQLRTLSEIIQEHQIEKIDLLKINVEKSEFDVLAGIADQDWQKIHQVVVEVHDIAGRLEQILTLFDKHGYHTHVEQDWSLHETTKTNYYLYATRNPKLSQFTPRVITTQPEPILTTSELRHFLTNKLPDYMVPSAFVLLEALPLNPNGKVDRQALPTPDLAHSTVAENYVAPRTTTEASLVTIWSEVLKLPKIGINDNFFELGGHSLLAIQMVARTREVFQVDLPLASLFDNPTVATLAVKIAALMPLTVLPIRSVQLDEEQEYIQPSSINQQSFWLFEQFHQHTPTYHIPLAFQLTGTLHLPALEQALSEMVRRHTILRTSLALDEYDRPCQRIEPPNPVRVTVIKTKTKSIEGVKSQLQEEIRRPFDLTTEPLFRVSVVHIDEQEQILLLLFHHLITDGWSVGLFIKELTTLYAACLEQRTLPATSYYQYVDFCHWQTQWLQSPSFETQLAYWQTQLAAPLPVLELPTDYPRPAVQTYRGARQAIQIAPSLTTALQQLSYQQGVTLFMTLLAAFKTLLYRYTGQPDLLVGTATAGRQRVEWEQVLGLFINTLVLRTHPTGSMSFTAFLQQVRDVAVAAYNHQDLPLQILLKEVHPERDSSHNPLFQTFFLLQNFDFPNLELAGLTASPVAVNTATCKFDLTLELYEQADSLVGWFEYNTDLFNAATIQRLVGHLQTLLADIVTNPEQSLSQLRLLTEAERNQCYNHEHIRPNNAFIEFPKAAIEQSIPARFVQQVNRYPQQIAVKTKQTQLTYLQLNEQANRVAEALLKQGVDKAHNIGLLFEHDAAMIVALLGVLKAGLTYVPLTPDLPLQRLSYILQDAQIRVLLTHQPTAGLAKQLIQAPRVLINIEELKSSQAREITVAISPDTPAYLLYTSGSTGQPKGVIQNHRNVLHFIRTYTNNLHIHTQDKLSLLSSYSFDAAVMDIFGALLNGATLCPINLKNDQQVHSFKKSIQQGITIYHSTPTVYRHLISTLTKRDRFSQLRLIVLGGEEVYQTDVEAYQQHFTKHCIFINGLGPSESTVTLQYFLNKQSVNPQPTVPVGYPVAETEIVLLNDRGEETELYGEIAIKSAYVALGYWQQPLLTQAAFRQDDNGRLYRTGDMGRLRADGSLEFAGRKDSQVKLRGHRIELGEIEAILKQHPAVQETVALLREDQPGLKQLVAYIVPAAELASTTSELRQFLKDKLPSYMIPSAIVVLATIPLLPNGKVNYRLLPVPTLETTDFFVAPRDKFEQQIAQIWEKILGIAPISVHDNFFEVGGDSLLAMTLLSRIEKHFDKHLPSMILFQAPTIAQQADILRKENNTTPWRVLEIIQPQGTRIPFFFIGSTSNAQALARVLGTNQPLYALNIFSLSGSITSSINIKKIAKQFITEIQTVHPEGPYCLGAFCGDAKLALEIALQLQSDGQEVALVVSIDGTLNMYRLHTPPNQRHFRRIYRHWSHLLEQGPIYLYHKIQKQLNYFGAWLRKVDINIRQRLGIKLNKWMQVYQFINAFRRAEAEYVPNYYSGTIALFLTKRSYLRYSPELGKLIANKVEAYEVIGEHDNLFVSPQIEALGKQLTHCLDQVNQSTF